MYILIPSPPLVLSRIATGNAHNCAFGKQSSVDIKGREALVCGSGLEIISPFSPITSKRSARAFMSSSSNSIFSSPSWHSLGGRLVVGWRIGWSVGKRFGWSVGWRLGQIQNCHMLRTLTSKFRSSLEIQLRGGAVRINKLSHHNIMLEIKRQ